MCCIVFFCFVLGIIKCPGECEWNPCGCCEPNIVNFCQDCHSNGCDQCIGGTTIFKRNYQYFCEYCGDIFGDACVFCQDYNGCGQCKQGYLKFGTRSNIWCGML